MSLGIVVGKKKKKKVKKTKKAKKVKLLKKAKPQTKSIDKKNITPGPDEKPEIKKEENLTNDPLSPSEDK